MPVVQDQGKAIGLHRLRIHVLPGSRASEHHEQKNPDDPA
jgi:hypothetical protein